MQHRRILFSGEPSWDVREFCGTETSCDLIRMILPSFAQNSSVNLSTLFHVFPFLHICSKDIQCFLLNLFNFANIFSQRHQNLLTSCPNGLSMFLRGNHDKHWKSEVKLRSRGHLYPNGHPQKPCKNPSARLGISQVPRVPRVVQAVGLCRDGAASATRPGRKYNTAKVQGEMFMGIFMVFFEDIPIMIPLILTKSHISMDFYWLVDFWRYPNTQHPSKYPHYIP